MMNEAVQELRELSRDTDVEELIIQREWESAEDDNEDDGAIADMQGDETIVLDRKALNRSLKLGRMLLVKASHLTKKGSPAHLDLVASQDIVCDNPFEHDRSPVVV